MNDIFQICQSVWSPQSVVSEIEKHCIAYLRLAAVLKFHLYDEPLPNLQPNVGTTKAHSTLLHKTLYIYQFRTISENTCRHNEHMDVFGNSF